MNAVRRARIRDVIEQIKTLERTVSRILNEEKAAYENLPDNIEHSAFSDSSRHAVGCLEEACGSLILAVDALEKVQV